MKLSVEQQRFPLKKPFTISRGSRSVAYVLVAIAEQDGVTGFGECVPYARYGETSDSVRGMIQSLQPPFDRTELQSLLPPGAARNAVDCALWDLEAKQSGRPVWEIAGLPPPEPLTTACTISLDKPEAMKAAAAERSDWPLLKIKLGGGPEDLDRAAAVRDGAPDARLIVDANEGWSDSEFRHLAENLRQLGVEMVEQPLPAGADRELSEKNCPLPVCADESCHGAASLPGLAAGYSMINIKLDKTGGLTEALQLRARAGDLGYRIMTGSMVGSSLAMAPALLAAQGSQIVDLDGPLLLAEDRNVPLCYDRGIVYPASRELWG